MTEQAYHFQRPATKKRRPAGSARDRGRLLLDLRGGYSIIADDHETEAALVDLAERITFALIAHVGEA